MANLGRHRARMLSLGLAGAMLLAGCGGGVKASGTLRLKDDTGTKISLNQPATRIVSLGPSNTEILLALGLGSDIVGTDDESVTYMPAEYSREVKGLQVVGDSYNGLNVEQIAKLHPQIILAMQGVKNESELKALKIPYATLDPQSLQGVYQDIRFVGAVTADTAKAKGMIAGMQKEVQAVEAAVHGLPKPSVFLEISAKPYYTAGPGSFMDSLLQDAGGINIADKHSKSAYPELSSETIVAANPQAIVLLDGPSVTAPSVAQRPGWSQIAAVKSGRVYDNISADYLSQPAPAVVTGLRELAQDLHPGVDIP